MTKCGLYHCPREEEKPRMVKLKGWLKEVPLCDHCFNLMTKMWKSQRQMPSYMELVYSYQLLDEYKKQKEEEERVYRLEQRNLDSLIDAIPVPG